MKKHNLYFLLTVLLAGLFASCSQEDMDGPQTNEPTSVTLSANVDGGIHTRADGKVTIPYFAFKLRYILEVWTTGANPELIYREEKTNSTGEGEDFTFTLVDNGDYKALLWADFVKGSGETTVTYSGGSYTHYEDQYYTTIPDLKTVTISRLALDGEGTSFGTITPRTSLDAFYACHTISKKDGAYAEPVVLTRPFGQINISEKDADALANVYRARFTYNVPAGFNVESGEPTQTTVQTKTIQELDAQLSTGDFTANLYYDYVFTPATGQTTLGEMTVTFPQRPESNIVIADYVIPANMPVVRNKRTNISGHIVSVSDKPSNDAKLSVTVSDGWSGVTEPIDIDRDDWDGTYPTSVDEARLWLGEAVSSGTDGKDYVFEISTAKQLCALQTLINQNISDAVTTNNTYTYATYKLTADINLNNHQWAPLGIFTMGGMAFYGVFDGQGHTISGLNVSESQKNYVGFIGYVQNGGIVKYLTVKGEVEYTGTGGASIGGIAGENYGTIAFCSFEGTVKATEVNTSESRLGWICGKNLFGGSDDNTGQIISCFAKGTISGNTGVQTGGMTAINTGLSGNSGIISGCTWYYKSGATPEGIEKCYSGWTSGGDNASYSTESELSGRVSTMNQNATNYNYKWEASGSTLKLVKKQ